MFSSSFPANYLGHLWINVYFYCHAFSFFYFTLQYLISLSPINISYISVSMMQMQNRYHFSWKIDLNLLCKLGFKKLYKSIHLWLRRKPSKFDQPNESLDLSKKIIIKERVWLNRGFGVFFFFGVGIFETKSCWILWNLSLGGREGC